MTPHLPEVMPAISFDKDIGESLSYIDIDFENLNEALIDAGIATDDLNKVLIHFNKPGRPLNANGVTVRTDRASYKVFKRVFRPYLKLRGVADSKSSSVIPITLTAPGGISDSKYIINRCINRSTGVNVQELTKDLDAGDSVALVLAHEATHTATALGSDKHNIAPKSLKFRNGVNEILGISRTIAGLLLLEEVVGFKNGVPEAPYSLLAIIGLATFIRRGAYYKKPEEFAANTYVLHSLQRRENNPWLSIISSVRRGNVVQETDE